ncbi:MAG: MBL fold metallo-hydrolase [Bacillota bacterium]|nr:MBL fold metallo-hydrolase [Bacillota bacterium]MDW7676337.1 MBL fold metallo-hydrolase [Bacillota bacterium]
MKLTVLVDNNTFVDQYYCGEPGLSYDIQVEDDHFLFDAGYSDVFMRNAEKMGIDWRSWRTIVISHGHADHTWGLIPLFQRYTEEAMKKKPLRKPRMLAHPDTFQSKWEKEMELGLNLTQDSLTRTFDLELTKQPLALTDRLMYLGEIPRFNDFENLEGFGNSIVEGVVQEDKVLDDTALAYRSDQGLVVITGCAHAGICNTIEQAKMICGEERILDVIGGFHLQQASTEVLQKTIHYLKQQRPRYIYAAHCTDLPAKVALAEYFDVKEVGVGLEVAFGEA